jgi:hypothetical protein
MSRVCTFCRREGQRLTLEHVYPDWLSKLFDRKIKGTNEVSGDNIKRIWQGTVFQHKVKLVCSECNNGWMSTIEGEVKDLLASVALTHNGCTLSEEDQRRLSLWVQKTVLIINKAISGDFDIPASFYEQLYDQKQPLANILVSMGWRIEAGGSKEQPLATFEIKQVSNVEVEKSSVDSINSQMNEGGLIWVATLGLGYVVFYVVGTNLVGQVEVGGGDHRIFPQISPYDEDLSWPTEWPIEAVGGLKGVRSGIYGDSPRGEAG